MPVNRSWFCQFSVAFAAVAALSVAGPFPAAKAQEEAGKVAASQTAEPPVPSGITARGSGWSRVLPDRAVLTFMVVVGGRDSSGTGVRLVEETAGRIAAALKRAGIPENDIAIAPQSRPQGGFSGGGFPGGGGFGASGGFPGSEAERRTRIIRVTVRQLANVPGIVEQAVQAGAWPEVSIRPAGGDVAAARNAALKQAVEEATAKAKAMASTAGIANIRLDAIKEENIVDPGFNTIRVDVRERTVPDIAQSIPLLSATVTVRYTLPGQQQQQQR